jgi:hypothetical protein
MIRGDVPTFKRVTGADHNAPFPAGFSLKSISLSRMRPVEGVSIVRLAARPMARGQKISTAAR